MLTILSLSLHAVICDAHTHTHTFQVEIYVNCHTVTRVCNTMSFTT